ncbi:MAG TPA: hypothetical protein VKS60_00235 [Stellaceae bacterium]|nr:hypothetical protein [Stellaceae bacterium]
MADQTVTVGFRGDTADLEAAAQRAAAAVGQVRDAMAKPGAANAMRAVEAQIHALRMLTDEAARGSEARVVAAEREVAFTTQAFGSGSAQEIAALRRLRAARDAETAQDEAAAARAAATKLAALRKDEAGELARVEKQRALGELSVEAARAAATQIVQVHEDAELRILAAEYRGAEEGSQHQQELARRMAAVVQESADRIAEINARAAEQVAAEWRRANAAIGRDFSEVVMAAIEGKKHGITAALRRITDGMLGDIFNDIGKALAGHLEQALNISGNSPGSLLSGLLGKIGLGDAASWLGIGGQASGAAGAAGTAGAGAALDTAGASLNTAGATLDTAGASLNTAAASLSAAAASLSAGSAGDAAGGVGLLGDILPFAGGGRPPVGVPSIVGERGPELFVPDSGGTIVPAGQWGLRAMPSAAATVAVGGDSGDFAPSISMPVTFHGGAPGISKGEFERMLTRSAGHMLGILRNMHRNAARKALA